MIMALPRRFLSGPIPDQRLTEAIKRHQRALADARRTTNFVARMGIEAQRAAEEAIEVLSRTWEVEDNARPPSKLV